jgi:hypothetical protein
MARAIPQVLGHIPNQLASVVLRHPQVEGLSVPLFFPDAGESATVLVFEALRRHESVGGRIEDALIRVQVGE